MSILDKVEKIGTLADDEVTVPEEDGPGLLLVITFKRGEQELFYMKKGPAIAAAECIIERLQNRSWGPVLLHNEDDHEGYVGTEDQVEDFRGVVMLDETVRAIRLIDPSDIPGKGD